MRHHGPRRRVQNRWYRYALRLRVFHVRRLVSPYLSVRTSLSGNCYYWRWYLSIQPEPLCGREGLSQSLGDVEGLGRVRKMGSIYRFAAPDPVVDPAPDPRERALLQRAWKGRRARHIRR